MQSLLRIFVVCALLVWTVPAEAQNNTPKLDGAAWLASTDQDKMAFLLGVELTIAAEKAIEEKQRAAGQDERVSPFVSGWMTALGDVPRGEIARRVSEYVEKTPQARSRHIFDIIWYEFIAPKVDGASRR